MSIVFSLSPIPGNGSFKNRRAAQRQTEEQRERVFEKYRAMIGMPYGPRNSLVAHRMASEELRNKNLYPEYWDDDTEPRLPLALSSSCFSRVVPIAGGVMMYFRSNPEKGYFYPCAGTKAQTAERLYDLFSHGSIGKYYHSSWGAANGARKVMSKSGKSYSYKLGNGNTLDLRRFNKMGAKYAPGLRK